MPGPASEESRARFAELASLIAAAPHNLVSRRERSTVLDVHVPECRSVGALIAPLPGSRWLDLGTGGGLPGLVLAIEHRAVSWTLVDGTQKKIDAVRGFADVLRLENVEVIAARAEQLAREPNVRGSFDGVVSRALARVVVAAELSRGFVADGGTVAFVKGPRWAEELEQAERALSLLRLTDVEVSELTDAVRPTFVVTMRADGPAPPAYPRRDGLPAAQPLGR